MREVEMHSYILFKSARDQPRAEGARYTLGLLLGLWPDIRGSYR